MRISLWNLTGVPAVDACQISELYEYFVHRYRAYETSRHLTSVQRWNGPLVFTGYASHARHTVSHAPSSESNMYAVLLHEDAMTCKRFPHHWPARCEGNPPVPGAFPSQRASDAEFWCFLWCQPEQTAEQTVKRLVNWNVCIFMCMQCLLCLLRKCHMQF